MIAGLLYLKNAYNLGDSSCCCVLENPYWILYRRNGFSMHVIHTLDSSNMTTGGQRKKEGLEELLKEILSAAVRLAFIKLSKDMDMMELVRSIL